ncbi:hypothetical protein ACTAB0_14180 [Pseudomonas syringae]|uniref:hypothetical protein n=1 Tax=Pseudomonas syringae TaxID=317 RepID=UPI003F7A6511
MNRNYQARMNSVLKRKEVVKHALADASQLRMRFEFISDLAKYIALRVQDSEMVSMVEVKELSGLEGIKASSRTVHYQTFLRRGSLYRSYLDEWWRKNSLTSSDDLGKYDYFLKYSEACSYIHSLKEKLREVEAELNQGENGSLTVESRSAAPVSDAYCFVENLLKEFQEFLLLEGGALVSKDSMRRVIATSEMLHQYKEWKVSVLNR